MDTLQEILARHRVEVLDHLDRELTVPVLAGPQAQGDVIVLPRPEAPAPPEDGNAYQVPAQGVGVVTGEAMRNTHSLHADGTVTWTPTPSDDGQDLGLLHVAPGATAWLLHPEHGATGIAPGDYLVRRQRQLVDEIIQTIAD